MTARSGQGGGGLTPAAAAELVGLTVTALLDLASEGAIPGALLDKLGWHFNRRGLETYLERRAKTARQDDAA